MPSQSRRGRPTAAADIRRAARRLLGLDSLLPGQAEAIGAVLEGRDTLAILRTGGGKSAVYQVAGALIPGSTVVISPLLALQRDQVMSIDGMRAGDAAALNSTLRAKERDDTLDLIEEGALEFILLAPEQLADPEVIESLVASQPSLFVVDEAHCISEWGHDFRSDYLRLSELVERLGDPVVLALTATAAPPVRDEIVARLRMKDPALIVRGFDRPNIELAVRPIGDARAKLEGLIEAVAEARPPGIVYAPTRRASEEIASMLLDAGVAAAAYHAGMKSADRQRVQDSFMSDDGAVNVIVATTAFGMGIDKPNVRFVFHSSASESIDAYHQEIGRAGRDGRPARAVLFYRAEDLGLRRYFAARGRLTHETFEHVLGSLRAKAAQHTVAEISRVTAISKPMTMRALDRLAEVGACRFESGRARATDNERSTTGLAAEAVAAEERRASYDRSRVEMMRAYAETRECRRNFLLNYFGEGVQGTCGNCDNDAREPATTDAPTAEQPTPFELNTRVRHLSFGEGTVQHYDDGGMTVLFDDGGYKTFDVEHTVEEGLLKPMPA